MAAKLGNAQKADTTHRTDVDSNQNNFHDFYRSFRVQRLYGESPVLPARPQPSATSFLRNPSEDQQFGEERMQIETSELESPDNMVTYGKTNNGEKKTKFGDTYSWQSYTSKSKELIRLAPDVPYRNTYGTTDSDPPKVRIEFQRKNGKPKTELARDLLPTLESANFDVTKCAFSRLTIAEAKPTYKSNGADRTTTKTEVTMKDHAKNGKKTQQLLGVATRERGLLHNQVCYSIDFFRKPEVEKIARPLPNEADYAYRRGKPKRGRSVAMLEYLEETKWPNVKRSQTAPSLLQDREKCHKSADAYIQYLQQQRVQSAWITPITTDIITDGVFNSGSSARVQKGTAFSAHWSAPPVTPRIWETGMTSVRSEFTPPTPSDDTSGYCDLPGFRRQREFVATKVTLTCHSDTTLSGTVTSSPATHLRGQIRRKIIPRNTRFRARNRMEQKRTPGYITCAVTAKIDDKQCELSDDKRETLTVDLRTVVDDVTLDV
ncbi:hypothetical protein LSH36_573g04019 [Paralvinella palmiformis]|uniref:Uncharacterized protein n=1 Tax=Paralvinella palmiformis TaxID=53620 RepID=A0AAD9J5Y0_9ANNE|nr:hypothetical protein LSH36_573g04019 [Paralvinella palmiformis]